MVSQTTETIDLGFYEIYPLSATADEPFDATRFPWTEEKERPKVPSVAIRPGDGIVWVKLDPLSKKLQKVDNEEESIAGFRFVRRRLNTNLAMLTRLPGTLVNGRPAQRLTALCVKDSVVLAPGLYCYVTERVKPYVGPPPKSLIGRPCPFCRIPFTEDTRIVMCRCGAAHHYEPATEEADPEDGPLRCFEKVRKCLACGRATTLEEYLEWDPTTS